MVPVFVPTEVRVRIEAGIESSPYPVLSRAEATAARLDGEVRLLGPGWVPIDTPDAPFSRASVLLHPGCPLVLERRSAFWVHTGIGDPPLTTEACRVGPTLLTWLPDAPIRIRDAKIPDGDIASFDEVRCTTRARTAFDLLRDRLLSDDESLGYLTQMLTGATHILADLEARIADSPRLPYRSHAIRRLRRLEALIAESVRPE